MADLAYAGIGAVGDSGNIRAYVSEHSPDITTQAQLNAVKLFDPLDDSFDGLEFVDEIPAFADADELVIYIDVNGVTAYVAEDATEFTLVNGSFVDPLYDPRLKSLVFTTLALTPTFNSGKLAYAATTTDATNVITVVTASADATATILNGETPVTSGAAATWATGANIVKIKVVCGAFTRTYTVTVTKS